MSPASSTTHDLCTWIERAIRDLERGWTAAALDALGRALALLEAGQ